MERLLDKLMNPETTRHIFNLTKKKEKSCLIMMHPSKESLPSGISTRM